MENKYHDDTTKEVGAQALADERIEEFKRQGQKMEEVEKKLTQERANSRERREKVGRLGIENFGRSYVAGNNKRNQEHDLALYH